MYIKVSLIKKLIWIVHITFKIMTKDWIWNKIYYTIHARSWKSSVVVSLIFLRGYLIFLGKQAWHIRQDGKIEILNNFSRGDMNNPDSFFNQRRLYAPCTAYCAHFLLQHHCIKGVFVIHVLSFCSRYFCLHRNYENAGLACVQEARMGNLFFLKDLADLISRLVMW